MTPSTFTVPRGLTREGTVAAVMANFDRIVDETNAKALAGAQEIAGPAFDHAAYFDAMAPMFVEQARERAGFLAYVIAAFDRVPASEFGEGAS